MNYPKWLEYADGLNEQGLYDYVNTVRLVQMAKDAWTMAYNAGAEGSMTPGEFCAKYQDEPKHEIPYVAFDHPNDGAHL